MPEPKHIILNKTTRYVYVLLYLVFGYLKLTKRSRISGFRRAVAADKEAKWNDYNFVMFSLVLPPVALDDDLPDNIANDIKTAKDTGWRW